MEGFNGNCPKCNSENVGSLRFEYNGDFVVMDFECIECGHEFAVIFDNAKICD